MLKILCGVLCMFSVAAAPRFPELRQPPATLPVGTPSPQPIAPIDLKAWESQRQKTKAAWAKILGPMPDRVPLNVQAISREELDDHFRVLLRYRNDAQTTNEAYLLIPRGGADGKRPGVVCLHPTSKTTIQDPIGLANREGVHHALHLVRRGYVCIAPRNYLWTVEDRSWKESAKAVMKEGPYTTGMAKMLFDAMRAVDVLVERPEVDSGRIGAIGHSLGGKEALFLPAFDERVIASISCEGGIGLPLSNWDADHYFGSKIKSPDFKHDNHEVMALIAPRALLVIGGESADGAQSWPYIDAALPLWRLYGAEDRIGLLRHNEGHNFPSPGPQRELAYGWLDRWLKTDK